MHGFKLHNELRRSQDWVVIPLSLFVFIGCSNCRAWFQDGVYRVFQQRSSIRKELLELQGKDYDISYKLYCKEVRFNRQELLLIDSEVIAKVPIPLLYSLTKVI